MRDFQDPKGETLDEMPYSGEGELEKVTSNRNTGHQVEGWGCHPTVKNSNSELFLSERTTGTKMEKSLMEGGPVTGPNWDPVQGWLQGLTLLLVYLQRGA